MAVPTADSKLANFSTNFNTRIVASATTFGLTSAQATQYTALHTPFIAAFNAINSPGAKSKSLVAVKNSAKDALLPYARQLYGLVQANMTVSQSDKELLGVVVRALPSPIPVPGVAPSLEIVSIAANVVRVRIHDNTGEGKRPRPPGVSGAAICSFTGPTAPTNPSLYKWEGNTTRSIFNVVFPESLAPGTQVFITAMWVNYRQQMGPACEPQGTRIQYGMSMAG